jgi:beta-glucuronidase
MDIGVGTLLCRASLVGLGFMAVAAPGLRAQQAAHREPMNTEVRPIDGVVVLFQYGQPVPSFDTWREAPPGRERLSLDGEWRFAWDPENQGLAAGWPAPDFDDSGWRLREVPASWDLYDTPGFDGYDGTSYGVGSAFTDGYAWFRRRVEPPATWKGRSIRLSFLGVNYRVWVYVNGVFVGEHEGGHTPFALDVSGRLQPGRDNVIAVRVYRRPWYSSYTEPGPITIRSDTEVPYQPVDYWPYAGITRSVYLEAAEEVTVSKLLTVAKDGSLRLSAVLHNRGDQDERRLLVVHPGEGTGGEPKEQLVTLAPGQVRVVTMEIPIPEVLPWDTASPNLYRATAALYQGRGEGLSKVERGSLKDSLFVDYGMRSVEVRDASLLLNGRRPIFLKGLNWHEETGRSGRSLTIEEYDRELGLALDLGANFIRNSVYGRHPYVYEFADAHGLLVMDDTDNMWLNTKQERIQTDSYGLSRALALTMAWNQVNHPSVILWCLQNESEIWADPAVYRRWLADMKEAVKSLDLQDRPVTWASSSSWDPAFDLADVVGFNEYFGFFYGQDSDLGWVLDAVRRNHPGKPILITENGTWSIYGDRGPDTRGGTEEWHRRKFLLHWDQVVPRKDFVAGYTFWLLKDYKQRMTYNHEYNGISTMGLIDFHGNKKLVYGAFRDAVNPAP